MFCRKYNVDFKQEIHVIFESKYFSSRLLSNNLKIKIYKTILSVILYGCETWSLILRKVRRLRVFENRIHTRKFGSRRDDSGDWIRLYNEEIHSSRVHLIYIV
jgi:hypothetical protein